MSHRIAVVVGSTRPLRTSPLVAEWTLGVLAGATVPSLHFALLDLASWNLPLLDEPAVPASGRYAHELTRKWSREISSYDGFVFVTPQYNWGYPAALKNALDHLYGEWRGKAAAIVSFGVHGGGKAAEQLAPVLQGGLHMRLATHRAEIVIPMSARGTDGQVSDPADTFEPARDQVLAIGQDLRELTAIQA